MSAGLKPSTAAALDALKAEKPFSPLRCPTCNRLPQWELDTVQATARLVNHGPNDENPHLQWEGTTDIEWDTQVAVQDEKGLLTLGCGDHEWKARKTGEIP
jgi:hypothetical protein